MLYIFEMQPSEMYTRNIGLQVLAVIFACQTKWHCSLVQDSKNNSTHVLILV